MYKVKLYLQSIVRLLTMVYVLTSKCKNIFYFTNCIKLFNEEISLLLYIIIIEHILFWHKSDTS